MKQCKRLLSLVLALVLVLGLLPLTARAERESDRGGGAGGVLWHSAFEEENNLLGWQMIDANCDDYTFGRVYEATTDDWYLCSNDKYQDQGAALCEPDDYLITPRIELPQTDYEYTLGIEGGVLSGGSNVSFDIYVYTGAELLRPDNLDSLLGRPYRYYVFSWDEWSWEYMDLSAYAGQTVQIVLRACGWGNDRSNALKIKEISVSYQEPDEQMSKVTATNVPLPQAGVNVDDMPESDITFPAYANYELVPGSLTYYKDEGEIFEEIHDVVFRADESYMLSFQVRPKDGIEVSSRPIASVNGKWAQIGFVDPTELRITYFNLPPLTPKQEVSEINLRVAPPVPGTAADSAAERWLAGGSADYHYTVIQSQWVEWATDQIVETSFESGKKYTFTAGIELEEGYSFAENPHFTVNGVPAYSIVNNETGAALLIAHFDEDYKQPIEAADLYMYPISHGDDTVISYICAQECASVWYDDWYDLFFLGEVPEDPMWSYREFFVHGIWYRVLFGLIPESEDQQFVPASRVTLNGTEAFLDHVEGNMYYYTADFKCEDPYWRWDFEGPWGFEGWSVIDANGDGNTFRRVEFTNQYDVTSYVVSLDQPIDQTGTNGCNDYLISPRITLPTGGQIELLTDQGGCGLEVYVYSGTEELNADNADRLLKNRIYSSNLTDGDIVMLWDYEYDLKYFEGQTVQLVFRRVSEKGGPVKLDNVRILHVPDGTLPVNFTVTAMNVPTPKPGQTVAELSDFTPTFPADAHYEMEPDSVRWYTDGSIGYRRMAADEVFAAGQPYHVEFGVLAKDGYSFFHGYANDVSGAASIDGERVGKQYDNVGRVQLWKDFDELESTVTVTFNSHGYGTPPEPVQIPKGSSLWDGVYDLNSLRMENTDGMFFWGWSRYPNDRKDDRLDWTWPLNEDVTLYAVWLEEICDVRLRVDQPIALAPIDKPYASVSNDFGFKPEGLGWWSTADGYQRGNEPLSGSFQSNKTYYGVVKLESELDSIFIGDDVVSVFGGTKVREERDEEGNLYVTFSVTIPRRTTAKELELFVDIGWNAWLMLGTPPTQLCLTPGFRLEEGSWWENLEDVGDESKAISGRFPTDCKVYTDAVIWPSLNCSIDYDNLTVTIRGGSLIRTEPGDNGSVHVIYSVYSPAYSGMEFFTEGSGWIFIDDDPHARRWHEGPFFETGPHTVRATADPGWHFVGWYKGSEEKTLVSTNPDYAFFTSKDDDTLTLTAVFAEGSPAIDQVEIRFPIPYAGDSFDWGADSTGAYIANDAPVAISNDNWYTEWGTSNNPLLFEDGQKYHVTLDLTATGGWRITEDTVIRINGEDVAWKQLSDGTFCCVSSRNYTVVTPQAIQTVEIKVPVPHAGESFNWGEDSTGAKVTNGAHVTISGDNWYNEWGVSGAPLPFVEGQNYYVGMELRAEYGWIFTEDTVVRINGEAITWKSLYDVDRMAVSSVLYLMEAGRPNPFVDVEEGKFYYKPVMWAYYSDPQVTAGTDETHFSPNKDCTRAQVVTFLWRAAGCPEPTITEHPFTDVKSTGFYYKAMLWAVENGITAGTTPTTFGPNKACTRAQVVTFLWRAQGEPEPTTTDCPFTDVKSNSAYYKAILWAVETGVTAGTSATTFSPGKTCNRGQVVTFLYRVYGPKG